jgi:hypothetical protein
MPSRVRREIIYIARGFFSVSFLYSLFSGSEGEALAGFCLRPFPEGD